MPEAICNTSPLVYLHRVGASSWLARLFSEVWIPSAVVDELAKGRRLGREVPLPADLPFLRVVDPQVMPFEWLSLDLGRGELAAMALALENRERVVLLDDLLARRTAQAAGLEVWGTLRVLLEAKSQGLTEAVAPWVESFQSAGMWISEDLRRRILVLAGEA